MTQEHRINWTTSKVDDNWIHSIARRAHAMLVEQGETPDYVTIHMDITACHANGCPLDLQRLAASDDANFGHDVFGIMRFMDRTTGRLTDHFVPHCAKRPSRTRSE